MNIGRNALYFRDYMVAIGYFNRVLEIRPWMAEPYFLRAYAKMMLEDFDGARKDASEALGRNAFLGQAYLVRAVSNHSLGNFVEAEKDYRKALSLSPDDMSIRFNLAGTFFEQDKYNEADSLANDIRSKARVYPASLLLRGNVAIKQQDTLRAAKLIEDAIRADSTLAHAYAFRADLYRLQDSLPAALANYNKAVEYAPEEEGLYINRGLARYQSNDYRGALEDYNRAISIASGNILARYNRALLRSFLGDYNNALEDFRIVLQKEPENYMALYNTGLLYSELGNYREAIKAFSKVIDKYKEFMPGYLARSEAKRKAGDLAGADRDQYTALNLQQKGVQQTPKKASDSARAKRKDANPTRNEEEEAIEAYQSLIAGEDSRFGHDAAMPESLRGRIQDREAAVSPMDFYRLTFFLPEKLLADSKYDAHISRFNERYAVRETLLSTASNEALDSTQVTRAQERLMELSGAVRKNAIYYFTRGLYKYTLVDLDGALSDLEKALEYDPSFVLARFAYASTRLKMIDLMAGARTVQAEENAPQAPPDRIMGKSTGTASRPGTATPPPSRAAYGYEEVVKALDKVIEKAPDMAIALYNRAIVAERLGLREEALDFYNRAIALNNAPAEAYYNRGLLHLSLGRRKEAIRDLSTAGEMGIFQAYNVLKRIR